eukprot:TRINITY_DN41359_c0_g1_i1.p1 TRINITY_DN41359_c0_g1~~TRINITY_DN41359_c0_g1_i1.p1  ORF type:complete len:471 (-),score=138.63 TRINITY_DN41359_c0_g1_i1:15-1427(-)
MQPRLHGLQSITKSWLAFHLLWALVTAREAAIGSSRAEGAAISASILAPSAAEQRSSSHESEGHPGSGGGWAMRAAGLKRLVRSEATLQRGFEAPAATAAPQGLWKVDNAHVAAEAADAPAKSPVVWPGGMWGSTQPREKVQHAGPREGQHWEEDIRRFKANLEEKAEKDERNRVEVLQTQLEDMAKEAVQASHASGDASGLAREIVERLRKALPPLPAVDSHANKKMNKSSGLVEGGLASGAGSPAAVSRAETAGREANASAAAAGDAAAAALASHNVTMPANATANATALASVDSGNYSSVRNASGSAGGVNNTSRSYRNVTTNVSCNQTEERPLTNSERIWQHVLTEILKGRTMITRSGSATGDGRAPLASASLSEASAAWTHRAVDSVDPDELRELQLEEQVRRDQEKRDNRFVHEEERAAKIRAQAEAEKRAEEQVKKEQEAAAKAEQLRRQKMQSKLIAVDAAE